MSTKPPAKAPGDVEEPKKPRFELQDGLLLAGIVLFLGGIAHFSVAVASIVAGLLCFGAVFLMERAERAAVIAKARGIDGSAHK